MRRFLSLLALAATLSAFQGGCIYDDPADLENVGAGSDSNVVSYGNGVYYFPQTKASFGNALSLFVQGNESLEVVAISGDGSHIDGVDHGYFVVTHPVRRCE